MTKAIYLITALGLGCLSERAAAESLSFRGIVTSSCALITPIDGTIALQSDMMSWATVTPASIIATNTGPATLTVARGTSWASSPANTPATTFSHSVSLTGANLAVLAGPDPSKVFSLLALGANILSVSMSANAPSVFPAGAYHAQVTVTCSVP